jgi:hypothetical protein
MFSKIVNLFVLISVLLLSTPVFAVAPRLINYQGVLTDNNGILIKGNRDLTFKIYSDSLTGTPQWVEHHPTVNLENGSFSVILGSVTPLSDNLFSSGNRWIGITINPGPEIAPRMKITSVPWAFRALAADEADGVEWSNITGIPAGFADGTDNIGGSGSGHSLSAADGDPVDAVYVNNSGQVGVGTMAPTHKLHVVGHIRADGFSVARRFSASTDQAVARESDNGQVRISGGRELRSVTDGVKGAGIVLEGRDYGGKDSGGTMKLSAMPGHSIRFQHLSKDGVVTERLIMDGTGDIGIGTTTPAAKLDVAGTIRSSSGGFKFPDGTVQTTASTGGNGIVLPYDGTVSSSSAAFSVTNDGTAMGVHGVHSTTGNEGSLGHKWAGVYGVGSAGKPGVTGFGSTGVGGTTYGTGIGVRGSNSTSGNFGQLGGSDYGVYAYAYLPSSAAIKAVSGSNSYAADFTGKVVIRSTSGDPVIELGKGLDYAEGFDVSNDADYSRGTVMIIDPDTPGKLTTSSEPYDSKVAGIIAGANGLGSGVRLGGDKFDYDIALAGRVYCNVDATENGVEPGDLLTTSSVPGYAMRVSDSDRAQGAIIGKAMEKLEKGRKGKILVLVTLQ